MAKVKMLSNHHLPEMSLKAGDIYEGEYSDSLVARGYAAPVAAEPEVKKDAKPSKASDK